MNHHNAGPRGVVKLALFFLCLLSRSTSIRAQNENANTLWIGNSYTAFNNLGGMVRAMMLESGVYDIEGSTFGGHTPGGASIKDHKTQAQTEGSRLNNIICGGTQWKWATIQEQSRLAGLLWRGVGHAVGLSNKLRECSPDVITVFFMTWGGRNGDWAKPKHPDYPDFLTMNRNNEIGYRRYVNATENSKLAPVGLGFEYIYLEDRETRGTDPSFDPESLFHKLYMRDGSHPSFLGTYLAACVFYMTMTDLDPRDNAYAPAGLTDPTIKARLQEAAYQVVSTVDVSRAPTDVPVDVPTDPPVPAPTAAPVPAPTNPPTLPPTDAPVPAPTNPPTLPPTAAPVPAPTEPPTLPPTAVPVPSPTAPPLPTPTDAGTVATPTDSPTLDPNKCYLCEDGSALPDPDLVVLSETQTCADAQIKYESSTDCAAIQATVGVYCGCSNPVATQGVCRACNDTLPDPSLELGGFGSCAEAEIVANNGLVDCPTAQWAFQGCCAIVVEDSSAGTTDSGTTGATTGYNTPNSSARVVTGMHRFASLIIGAIFSYLSSG